MSEIKWYKVDTNMFEDEKLKLIDALEEREAIYYVWMRLLSQAAKNNENGKIFLTEKIRYTVDMLAILFNRPIEIIKMAIKTLSNLSMIKVEKDKTIRIINWDKHQNIEGMDKIREQTKMRVAKYRNEMKSSNIKGLKKEDNSEKKSNVTENECNVTVTQQNKNKNKKKNQNKKEERDKEIIKEFESNNEISEGCEKSQKISEVSFKVLAYYERITGIIGVLTIEPLKLAIAQHGEKYVRMAIDKSIEVNKANMTYVNGILKNWRRDGYPKEELLGNRQFMMYNGNKFKGFKPKKPRELTEEEREHAKENLI